MAAPQNIIAVIFDFDDTLTDETTTKLLAHHGIDPAEFWQTQNKEMITKEGWDPVPAYLKLMLDLTGDGKPLGRLKNSDLRKFGESLEFYTGIPQLFDDLVELAQEHEVSRPAVEFYVITSGLEEIVRGSAIASRLADFWGCNFAEGDEGCIEHVKNVVSFTEKTRFIFEINKGLRKSRNQPYDVNKDVPEPDRRILLRNMIYVGDGLTDVPCFSLIQKNGGKAFGVFDPRREGSPKKALESLVAPKRVSSLNSPKYGPDDDLGAILRTSVNQICVDLDLRTQSALR
jgi:phosphoserine phosphatase